MTVFGKAFTGMIFWDDVLHEGMMEVDKLVANLPLVAY